MAILFFLFFSYFFFHFFPSPFCVADLPFLCHLFLFLFWCWLCFFLFLFCFFCLLETKNKKTKKKENETLPKTGKKGEKTGESDAVIDTKKKRTRGRNWGHKQDGLTSQKGWGKGEKSRKEKEKKKWETTTKKRVVGKWASELTVLLLQVSSSFVCVQSGLFFFWFWRRTSKKRAKRTTHKTKRVNQKIIQKKTCKAQRVSTENGLLVSYLRSRGLLSPKQTKNKQKTNKNKRKKTDKNTRPP